MFEIKVDTKELEEAMARAGRELRFSMAKALTDTAKVIQARVLIDLDAKFTLRTGWYKPSTPYGIKIKGATKDNLESEVYTKAPWMQLHEYGGVKTAKGKRIAIPFTARQGRAPGVVYGVKRTKRDLVMNSQKPRNLAKAFILQGRRGDLLAMRTGKGNKAVLRILYALEQKAVIKKRLGFRDVANEVIRENWRGIFERAVEYALKTSKLK